MEEEFLISDVRIKYMYKKRKYDNQHLLIIFSGFGGTNEFTYDFVNSLKDAPSHILWIKDDFEGHCCYYLCKGMDFKIESAVYDFILQKISSLGLEKSQCTLAGFSKGGTAALYFGLKYNFTNIISTVPQFHIGSYVHRGWKDVAKHMLGDITQNNINRLDNVLPKALSADVNLQKNIYLLTSESDNQYIPEIKPYLAEFIKYTNFNLFISKSKLVREHKNVTAHHVPLLISLFYSLAQGAAPRYGYVELLGDNNKPPADPIYEPITILKKIRIESGFMFPEGVCVIKGLSCSEYSDISHKLICEGDAGSFEWDLAKDHLPRLTRDLYDDHFVNYDKGWFCSYRYKGLDISNLPQGKYTISITVTCQGVTKKNLLTVDQRQNNKELVNTKNVKFFSENNNVFLEIQ